MTTTAIVRIVALLAVLAIGLAACQPVMPPSSGPQPAPAAGNDLGGVTWQLVAYVDASGAEVAVLPGTEITAEFAGGQVGGSAGCNRYFASYQVDGDSLTIQPIGSTMMACEPPVMEQESAYLAALANAAAFQIDSGELRIADAGGQVILTYSERGSASLTGTTWVVTMVNNGRGAVTSIVAGTELTALFGEDGSLSGSAGCNSYRATYTVDGASIDIGPAATTRMMCAAEGVMEQESQYLAALEMAEVYRVDGDALELRTADGALAVSYGAQPAAAAGGDEGTTAVASSPSLTGVAWQLQQIQSMDDTVTTPGDPANYTVEFLDDGTVAIQADCNRAAGTYTVDGSQLAIQLGPMTTALCPEGSLSDEFVRNLGDTVSYVFDNGNLYLATKMDGAILEFAPAP